MLPEIRATILKIPKGKVATYGSVAKAAGFEGRARQVAWALRSSDGKLPWHRVLGAGGKISLPGMAGIEQRFRLQSEGVKFAGGKVRMEDHEHIFRAARARRVRKSKART